MSDDERVTERVLERTRRYVEHETPSGDAERAAALADEIASDLRQAGADARTVEAPGWGAHVVATLPGREPEAAPVLLLGHLDTVWPVGTLAERPFRMVEGRAEGPGVYDMKAPLAVLVEALSALRSGDGPARPVHILVTCDEEVGSPTSRERIEEMARGAAATLVLEPCLPGGAAKTARKGVVSYELEVAGRSAHAGIEPERGVSATVELARQILRIAELAEPELGTTVNIGVIGGGTAGNVVPAEARAAVEVRYATDAERRRVDGALRGLRPVADGAELWITPDGPPRPPLERTTGVVALYRHARSIAGELGFELGEGSTGGGSDGCFTAALGVPTLDGLGVDGGGAHAVDEHIRVADLPRRVALLVRMLRTL